eukprot:3664587-Pyramimonas_sp.AAC.1
MMTAATSAHELQAWLSRRSQQHSCQTAPRHSSRVLLAYWGPSTTPRGTLRHPPPDWRSGQRGRRVGNMRVDVLTPVPPLQVPGPLAWPAAHAGGRMLDSSADLLPA